MTQLSRSLIRLSNDRSSVSGAAPGPQPRQAHSRRGAVTVVSGSAGGGQAAQTTLPDRLLEGRQLIDNALGCEEAPASFS